MTIRLPVLAAGLLAGTVIGAFLPSAATARSSQWWYVAQGAGKVLFVDVDSIQREGDTVRYEASQILREPENPAASIRAFMTTDCRARTENWDLVMRYGPQDERLDASALAYDAPEAVGVGTLGEAQMQFVCAPDLAQTGGFAIAIDEVAFTEALLAGSDASESPLALHERMRADPRVPVIRSTAPAPETFGTEQRVLAGQAIVPPRDYAKSLQAPQGANYDTGESGTIYDIAYVGIEGGELVFERRGYSIGDLARASSAQSMRFGLTEKAIHISDIEIAIIEATPQALRFRAQLAPEQQEDSDAPFPCNDPACSPR
ncbi:surface-adhesin E family protein [Novosphingobium sp. PhB55]|uniref:surface-adhesin E family protein n=1 Tax=Novosphingobium sp. PhB55 TaxID=2485106 RepID=UPI001065448C|nr:surface-adhesin E family protein [Novosphingobium sp. PhB55]